MRVLNSTGVPKTALVPSSGREKVVAAAAESVQLVTRLEVPRKRKVITQLTDNITDTQSPNQGPVNRVVNVDGVASRTLTVTPTTLKPQISLQLKVQIASTVTTLSVIAISRNFQAFFDTYLSTPIILFCVICFGIPHGALDHLLFYQLIKHRVNIDTSRQLAQNVNSQCGGSGLVSALSASSPPRSAQYNQEVTKRVILKLMFYMNYLSIMIAWGLMWAVAPVLCFWAFMAISAFHFGEVVLKPLFKISVKTFTYFKNRAI
jgi:hypothetical protein